MVDSNVSLASERGENEKSPPTSSHVENISQSAARENVVFLKTQADSWLAVLFNVFGTVECDERGKIGDVIKVWAGIAKAEVCFVLHPPGCGGLLFHSISLKHLPKSYNYSNKTSQSQLRPRQSRG